MINHLIYGLGALILSIGCFGNAGCFGDTKKKGSYVFCQILGFVAMTIAYII